MSKPRGVLIAGNWKMNHGPKETKDFFEHVSAEWKNFESKAEIYAPDISLVTALEAAKTTQIKIGAQNVHWETKGAFTGEISAAMLGQIGINRALVGHSERRQYFGENDETAGKRTLSLLKQGFQVILCIGETLPQRESGETKNVLLRQLGILSDETKAFMDGRLIIAYEPVWAIGTGVNASPEQAEESHKVVREDLFERFGMQSAGATPILYGGSVKPENIDSLLKGPNIDGALVGGASVKPESFLALLEAGDRYTKRS